MGVYSICQENFLKKTLGAMNEYGKLGILSRFLQENTTCEMRLELLDVMGVALYKLRRILIELCEDRDQRVHGLDYKLRMDSILYHMGLPIRPRGFRFMRF